MWLTFAWYGKLGERRCEMPNKPVRGGHPECYVRVDELCSMGQVIGYSSGWKLAPGKEEILVGSCRRGKRKTGSSSKSRKPGGPQRNQNEPEAL